MEIQIQEKLKSIIVLPFKMILLSKFNIDGIQLILNFIKNKTFSNIIYVSESGLYNEYIKTNNHKIQFTDYEDFKYSDKTINQLVIFDIDYKTFDTKYKQCKIDCLIDYFISSRTRNTSIIILSSHYYDLPSTIRKISQYLVTLYYKTTKREKNLIRNNMITKYNEDEIDKLFLLENISYSIITPNEVYHKIES